MMRHLRKPRTVRAQACFGVISFYPEKRPWESAPHLSRIHDGMTRRATELGYRLDPLWLTAPGLSLRRFREILQARSIEGLLCFGSPDVAQVFPRELNDHAIVTVGFSIRTNLHRVTSRPFNDTLNAFNRLRELGYQRPGLVLSSYEDARTYHSHSAAYLGWCEDHRGLDQALPILRLDDVVAPPFLQWRQAHRPDCLVFVHSPSAIRKLRDILDQHHIRTPQDIGIAVQTHTVEGSGFAGLQQNLHLMGAWAVELLAARIANRDFGIPTTPRVEMVESEWVDGDSLRPAG
jgi:LacI family transcriptional regulator